MGTNRAAAKNQENKRKVIRWEGEGRGGGRLAINSFRRVADTPQLLSKRKKAFVPFFN
jgi:hypothetical protein